MIFYLWKVQQGTSSLHREMERPSEKVAWGEEKSAITLTYRYNNRNVIIQYLGLNKGFYT
jgi:hypothetical protein